MSAQEMVPDFVDGARRAWAAARPEWDVASIEVMGRIARIAALASQHTERELAPVGLTRSEFDVLCMLSRAAAPMRASEVTAATMLSGASTTKNVDRLVKRGLVERLPWEWDGRVVLIGLTADGVELVDREFPRFLARDHALLDGLEDAEQEQLAALLRKISIRVESGS